MTQTRLAVDIGGTFTDVVLELADRRLATKKVLTTTRAPEEGVMRGMRELLAEAGVALSTVDVLVHGTTLATNAIIERKGARTALIATEGFRDVLDIAYESRYDQYDIFIEKPVALVPRARRFTVPERVDVEGRVLLALDEAAVATLPARLVAEGIESVAIALLHAYANPDHERRVREILAGAIPGLAITLSSEVCPEVREYERTSTAVANAYVQPLIAGYLGRLDQGLEAAGFRGTVYLMTSGGGLTSLEAAARFPIRLVESGPAGGAILATHVAALAGERKVLSFDMGGTTAKICLIENLRPETSRAFEVDRAARFLKGSGLPLRIPVIEMVEIGAGGGSIATVDAMKRIVVGPGSAGSEPGPACYGRGGERPTVTDADVMLGRIDPERFAGGKMPLDAGKAATALAAHVGRPLGLSDPVAGFGVAEIVDENMANAARVHAVERGRVVAEATLIAFGGAAPLHASRLAEKLGIRRIIVPANAGVGSAIGFLRAPVAYEVVRSRYMRLDALDAAAANALFAALAEEARQVVESGARGQRLDERRTAYMRYVGQGHEIVVPVPVRPLAAGDAGALRTAFEREYQALFQRIIPEGAIEVLSWTLTLSTPNQLPRALAVAARRDGARPIGRRAVFDAAAGSFAEVPVYGRADLAPGQSLAGPALIAEDETTTFVSARFDARIDAAGSIVLERRS
ncbi:MAG: hydantoinase/oxoprolinase family protein [Alphaproteobacteria bacterium]|nr:hydantoinase/oxoprolinase family protein [Alphaproteobacteria bacterium]